MRQPWRDSSAVFHQRAQEYDSWFDDSLLFAIETTAIRALPFPLRGPGLEIGVGPGRFAAALGSTFGIDPAAAPLAIAKSRGIRTCQAIGEALPFRANSFATVSLLFTLCFLQNPGRVLQESRRVLEENGHIILGLVPATSVWGKNLRQKKEADHPFYKQAHFFTIGEVKTLLAEQGFSVKAAVSSLYQPPGKVVQEEESRPGMDEKAGFVVLMAQAP
ncbi:MAG: class I SAM-dependent methyltransferase [Proteobacteria bacterium]|nr:class I SAM-dependent methyltransferase [Pseudomonadota bacterium]MBU1057333.1 class I SAM-dependent methyltransferase [Pseudomonadota bacterium]